MSLLTNLFRLIPPSLRGGDNYCPQSYQELANDIIGGTRLTFLIQQGNFLYNYGSSTPVPENRVFPWLNTTDGLWYTFQMGLWISRFPILSSSKFRYVWLGSAAELETLDGGSAGVVSPTTGPFWELDTTAQGRTLVVAGTIPGTSPARTLTVEGTSDSSSGQGEWVHTISRGELPNERLHLAANTTTGEPVVDLSADGVMAQYSNPDSESQAYRLANASGFTDPTVGVTEALGQGESFLNTPPFYGINLAKRTARVWKTIAA